MFNFTKNDNLKRGFEQKIIEHIDSLYTMAFCMTRNKQDAEDLVQDTAARAYRFFHQFEIGTNFKAWIMTILRNTYINQYRKKTRKPQEVSLEEVENYIGSLELGGVQEEKFNDTINVSIEKLPEDLRITLTLFYIENFSYSEIAAVMNCPKGTVMSRLYTARQMLKKLLVKYYKKDGIK